MYFSESFLKNKQPQIIQSQKACFGMANSTHLYQEMSKCVKSTLFHTVQKGRLLYYMILT